MVIQEIMVKNLINYKNNNNEYKRKNVFDDEDRLNSFTTAILFDIEICYSGLVKNVLYLHARISVHVCLFY